MPRWHADDESFEIAVDDTIKFLSHDLVMFATNKGWPHTSHKGHKTHASVFDRLSFLQLTHELEKASPLFFGQCVYFLYKLCGVQTVIFGRRTAMVKLYPIDMSGANKKAPPYHLNNGGGREKWRFFAIIDGPKNLGPRRVRTLCN